MPREKYSLNYDLRRVLSDDDWSAYQRFTVIADDPPMSELPRTRNTYLVGFVLSGMFLVISGIGLATGTSGGTNAVVWMVTATAAFFITLLVAAFFAVIETRATRGNALAGREALAVRAQPAFYDRPSPDERVPHYPVTDGEYNPSLY